MAGDPRRAEVQSQLGNSSDLRQGVGLQATVAVPGVQRPNGINVAPVSMDVANQLVEWGGAELRNKASKEMQKRLLDGEMAYQQGQALGEVNTGGDKWMAEGYHVMEAQTLSATFLSAQKNEIQNSGYALSPEQFRAQYVSRLDAIIDGKDPRVQELVRKQMAEQMPSLIAMHTDANMGYSLQRTAESGVAAINALSQDPSGDAALKALADPGAASALSGLGPNERRSVITQGVLYAFQQDNPAAYIKLKASGLLDQLTPEQQEQIENGRKAYQSELRNKADATRAQEFDNFYTALADGKYDGDPITAYNAGKALYAKYGLEMSDEEGWKFMTAARTGAGLNQQTTMLNIDTALVSKDYQAAGTMIADKVGIAPGMRDEFLGVMTQQFAAGADVQTALQAWGNLHPVQNSGGPAGQHPDSAEWRAANLSTVGINGQEWVVNNAAKDAFQGFLTELAGMGYNATSSGGYNYRLQRGSTTKMSEHADGMAIDINAATNPQGGGTTDMPANIRELAAKWGLKWGGDFKGDRYDPMHFEFIGGQREVTTTVDTPAGPQQVTTTVNTAWADNAMLRLAGAPTAEQRYNAAQAANDSANQQAVMQAYSQMAPQLASLDDLYATGQIDQPAYQAGRESLFEQYHMQQTKADVDHAISMTNSVLEASRKAAADAQDQQRIDLAAGTIADAENQMYAVLNDPNATLQDQTNAINTFGQVHNAALAAAGLPQSMDEQLGFNRTLRGLWDKAVETDRVNSEKMAGAMRAANSGSLGTDTSVDKATRDKWWRSQMDAAQISAAKAVAADPSLKGQENALVQQTMVETMSKSGYVPDDYKAQWSATLNGPLLDKQGNPTAEAISTVTDYLRMQTLNPRVAKMMLDPAAKAIADDIIARSGNNVARVPFSIQQRENAGAMITGAATPQDFIRSPEVTAAVNSAVETFFGDDKWFANWRRTDAYRPITDDPTQRFSFMTEVARVTGDMFAISGGKGKPDTMVKAAAQEVESRTAILGGTPFVAQRGVDLGAETFGPGLSNLYGQDGQKMDLASDPSSIDNAVRKYIVDNAGVAGSGIPVEAKAAWNEVSIPAEGWLDVPGSILYAARQSMSFTVSEKARMAGIDYSPMAVRQQDGGSFLMVSIQPADMSPPVIVSIPLAKAGAEYIKYKQQGN